MGTWKSGIVTSVKEISEESITEKYKDDSGSQNASPLGFKRPLRRRDRWCLSPIQKAYRSWKIRLCLLITLALATIWFIILVVLVFTPSIHLVDDRPLPSNGLQSMISSWKSPNDSVALLSPWRDDFSKDINPIPCHSHNDEQEQIIPLFHALSTGCTAVEADIHPGRQMAKNNTNILVGHAPRNLNGKRTLQTLYLDPLLTIMQNLNPNSSTPTSSKVGVYSKSPNTTLVLMLDFKVLDANFWELVQTQLEPLRNGGYLTHWANNTLTRGPITIVASGDATFETITSNTTYRDIFLDAPLRDISNPKYTTANSYYASTSLHKEVGYLFFGRYSKKQLSIVKSQITAAREKGLVSRYWGTIDRPRSWRFETWKTLVGIGVGILNVDHLDAARRWDWCGIPGFRSCGT